MPQRLVFDGRVAIVTGGAQGIGEAICRRLNADGALLVVSDLEPQRPRVVQATWFDERRVVFVGGDVGLEETAARVVAAACERFGRVDVLVNNAGLAPAVRAEELTVADWNRVVGTCLTGAFLAARAVGRVMIEQRSGAICNITSAAAHFAVPLRMPYVVAKHGLLGLTRALAIEWSHYGIRTNAVSPGAVATEIARELAAAQPEMYAERSARNVMDEFAEPADVAEAVAFLCSPAARYINGACLVVDGGNAALYSGYAPPRAR